MKKYHLLILCALAFFVAAACFVGCVPNSADAFEINVSSSHGVVDVVKNANVGDRVKFSVKADEGYELDKVYVNGNAVKNDFVMPDGEVRLLATYVQKNGYNVVCESDFENGVTVADLSVASKGSTITLHTYLSYGKKLVGYVVNGTAINGNKFTMPDGDVMVVTKYADAFDGTELVFTVTQSATNVTSHWRVEYKEDGLSFNVQVEDSVLYSVTSLQQDEAYIDNIEFILGFADSNGVSWGLDNYKIIIASNGAFRFQRYNGNGWINYSSSVTCKVAHKKLFDDGYAGYSAEMFIPYTALDTTYRDALNNVTIAVAMRNAVNGLNSTWAYCSKNGCLWNSPQTHFLIKENGFAFDTKPSFADCLFVGNGLFDLTNWTNFASSVKNLGDCVSLAENGASIEYWNDNIEQITSIKTDNVIFGGGAEDIAEVGVLQAFARIKKLTESLLENGNRVLLTSQIPLCGVTADNDAFVAFDEMVEDYAKQTDGVEYVDVISSLYKDRNLYKSLYRAVDALSEDGYRLLSKQLLKAFDKYTESGNVWGDNGNFVATCEWTESGNEVSLNQGGIQETFLKGNSATDFEFTATLTANGIYNSDAWPKMGLTLHGTEGNYYFYVDATSTLDNLVVGLVQKLNDSYLWSDVSTGKLPEGTVYTRGNYITMAVRKVGNNVRCMVNGDVLIDTDLSLGNQPCVVGLFCFNMQVNVKNWSFTDLSVD